MRVASGGWQVAGKRGGREAGKRGRTPPPTCSLSLPPLAGGVGGGNLVARGGEAERRGRNPPPASGGSGRGECVEHDGMVDEHGHASSLPLPLPQAGGVISSSPSPPALSYPIPLLALFSSPRKRGGQIRPARICGGGHPLSCGDRTLQESTHNRTKLGEQVK